VPTPRRECLVTVARDGRADDQGFAGALGDLDAVTLVLPGDDATDDGAGGVGHADADLETLDHAVFRLGVVRAVEVNAVPIERFRAAHVGDHAGVAIEHRARAQAKTVLAVAEQVACQGDVAGDQVAAALGRGRSGELRQDVQQHDGAHDGAGQHAEAAHGLMPRAPDPGGGGAAEASPVCVTPSRRVNVVARENAG